jgi:hypothetical protein
MAALTTDAIIQHAAQLARDTDVSDAVDQLIVAAGPDRAAIESARDRVAAQLHRNVGDWQATATLTVLNRALSRMPRTDPLDWRVRWSKHRKP